MATVKEQNIELNRIYKRQNELYHHYAVRCGFSDAAFWILYMLFEGDEIYTQNDLSQALCLPKQTVNSAISSLVKSGYVCLTPLSSARNSKAVALTADGISLCQKTVIPLTEIEQKALSRMRESDREIFLKLSEEQYQLFKAEFDAAFSGEPLGCGPHNTGGKQKS